MWFDTFDGSSGWWIDSMGCAENYTYNLDGSYNGTDCNGGSFYQATDGSGSYTDASNYTESWTVDDSGNLFGEDSIGNSWAYYVDGNSYYYFADGDIEYYSVIEDLEYYYDDVEGTWYVWNNDSTEWDTTTITPSLQV